MDIHRTAPMASDDEPSVRAQDRVVVIGCGNSLRGDDAVGPALVRQLCEDGVPDHVTVVDGGTAGMTVAFTMRGADTVVLVDAASTGAEPGTIFRVSDEQLDELPAADPVLTHDLRWQHALSLGRWMLGGDHPDHVVVYLIEIGQSQPGTPMSAAVEQAMYRVVSLVRAEWDDSP